jgi:hypothetical protein
MHVAKTARWSVLAAAIALLVSITTAPQAEAGGYGRHHGGGLALGIGSLIVGGIIADRHYRHRSRSYYYGNSYYEPNYGYYGGRSYSYGGRRHHRQYGHRRWN